MKDGAYKDLRSRWLGNHTRTTPEPDDTIEEEMYRLVQRWESGDTLNSEERMALAAMEVYTQIPDFAQNPNSNVPKEIGIEAKYHVLDGDLKEVANKNTPINTQRRDEETK